MTETIEIKWDLLGAKLASIGADEQSEFFKGFARELASPSYESHYRREMQMLYVNAKMSREVKETLCKYFPSLWYEDGKGPV